MRVSRPDQLDRYDCLYVSAHAHDVSLACASRLSVDAGRGLRILWLTLFDDGDGPRLVDGLPGDHVYLGLPDARRRGRRGLASAIGEPSSEDQDSLAQAAGLLYTITHRIRARHVFLPLGVGGHVDHLLAHEAGMRSIRADADRDVFLYEERPDALVRGAVRIRLAEIGARLPPAAEPPASSSAVGFLWRLGRAPHVRTHVSGIAERVSLIRWAIASWRRARGWRAQKARGPRLQPVLHQSAQPPPPTTGCPAALLAFCGAVAIPPSQIAQYTRHLGANGYGERYWLVLPDRDEFVAAHPAETELP